jgi:hypothetical protein
MQILAALEGRRQFRIYFLPFSARTSTYRCRSNEAIEARQVRSKCNQILIGKGIIQAGAKKGQEYAKQGRCYYCIKRKIKEDKEGSIRSRRTAYTCSCHPAIYCCKAGLGTCWLEHLADLGDDCIESDPEGENIDGGVNFEI